MMRASLIALLAPSAALAFTAQDLRGVWHCVRHDGFVASPPLQEPRCSPGAQVTKALCEAVVGNTWGPLVGDVYTVEDNSDDSERVVVFDTVANSLQTRRISGRTYYRPETNKAHEIEEHDFHGVMSNAVEGSFYLDPNAQNIECNGAAVLAAAVAPPSQLQPRLGGQAYTGTPVLPLTEATDPHWIMNINANQGKSGSCRDVATGPWNFEFSDVDHFTLQVATRDMQQDHHETSLPIANTNYNYDRVFQIEKCMRGLPDKSEMCARLQRSGISTDADMHRACAGPLECAERSSSQQWGCENKKCCSVRGYVAPAPVYYNQPAYNNYYQQQPYNNYYQQQPYNNYQQPQFNYWG